MSKLLRVGVIGLGPRWRRYRAVLQALRDRFQVRAMCDQVEQRAVREAARLGCEPAAGPSDLLQRDDVQAVLLLDAQWFGLWPVELACRLGKPVYCGPSLEYDDDHADALCRQVRDRQLPVMPELLPRFAPATARLRELFATVLGPPRLLVCDLLQRPPRRRPVDRPVPGLLGAAGIALVDWCVGLMGGRPAGVRAAEAEAAGLGSVLLEFEDGRAVQFLRRLGPAMRPTVRLDVTTERGRAAVALPDRVLWATAEGTFAHMLPCQRPLVQVLLERFHRAVAEGQPPEPTLDDAYRALGWLRAARRSRAEGGRVVIDA